MDNLNLTKTDETRRGGLMRFQFFKKMIHNLSERNISEDIKFEIRGIPKIFQIKALLMIHFS